jgi:hypothetical protein
MSFASSTLSKKLLLFVARFALDALGRENGLFLASWGLRANRLGTIDQKSMVETVACEIAVRGFVGLILVSSVVSDGTNARFLLTAPSADISSSDVSNVSRFRLPSSAEENNASSSKEFSQALQSVASARIAATDAATPLGPQLDEDPMSS